MKEETRSSIRVIGIKGKTGFANWVIRKSTSSNIDGAELKQD
ncbi:MAG: hypothetical protein WBJ10_14555 [Daejeonella sp.]